LQASVYEYFSSSQKTQCLCVANTKDAKLAKDAVALCKRNVYALPDLRVNYGDDLLSYSEELQELFTNLRAYYQDESSKKVLVVPARTLFSPLPKKELFSSLLFSFGQSIDYKEIQETFLHWGYSVVDVVESPSEVSFRGDIIDIFPIDKDQAIRISFFDDYIESIRYFDVESQKSNPEELEEIEIVPALFSLNGQEFEKISQKIEDIQSDSFIKDIHSMGLWALNEQGLDYFETFEIKRVPFLDTEIEEIGFFDSTKAAKLKELEVLPEAKKYKSLEIASVKSFLEFHKKKKLTLLAKSEVLLRQHELDSSLNFIQSDLIVNLISNDEIILSLNKAIKKRRKRKPSILLDELKIGDYVVHEHYGIGIFKGLQKTTVLGSTRDFVQILYQGEDKLLLPVENLDVIDRYISDGGSLAIVDKLGKGSFQKLKSKTQEKLFEIASQIVATAAKREMIDAPIIKYDERLVEFQEDSGFEYTQDQTNSINAIFNDLSSGKMMDRLLSGDVGFGKTEVAMNAIFACALNGFQSIMVVPTTLLSSQHYKSLYERFKKYGLEVGKLDRFTTSKQKANILTKLKNGELKVCVGTHALLGIQMKNPALIVVDEEHKFGVKQKEKLKQISQNVHILSMSATPIPRSLNMALSSIKQYSTLLNAPIDRQDVRTFVKEYEEQVLKEAILRELRRGGQVFFVHNRIASIEGKKKDLQALMPNLRILTLHSKISATITEKEMLKFENKEYDILVSTSIIESGIHMPNVNTIIIDGSENFGIADLHQMRGRVGRSKRQGYCYFIVKDKDALSEQSKKRLLALESNSYLGSGSVLAYHDLEIRGGGNLIGEAQSGHIKNIGYSLYLKMLEDAINTLLNNTPIQKREVEIKLSISAYINSDYINEDRVRLELYRRLSKCDSVHKVLEIEEEMLDRFGKLDIYTKQFLDLITIKILASTTSIVSISNYAQNITLKDENEKKTLLKAKSKDDDDIIATVLAHLRSEKR
jgi:transcription-repair coupling factor (superfamily II helicase)